MGYRFHCRLRRLVLWLLSLHFFYFSTSLFCIGQAKPSYSLRHYTDQNGLPQNSIKSIAADQDGFIWLGTENGLVRYDGTSFYTFDQSNSAVSSNRIFTFQPDLVKPFHKFYVWTENEEFLGVERGVARVDSLFFRNTIKRYPQASKKLEKTVICTGAPNPYKDFFLPEIYVIPIPRNTEGRFYVCTNNQVSYYERWEKKNQTNLDHKKIWDLFSIKGVLYCNNGDGTVNIIHRGSGTKARKDQQTPTVSAIKGDIQSHPDYESSRKKNQIVLYWNHVSSQVFLSLKDSFYLLDSGPNGELTATLLFHGFDFASNHIQSVYYDKKRERIFLGSLIEGLFTITINQFKTLQGPSKGMDNVFYAQGIYDSSAIFTASGTIFDAKNNSISNGFRGYLPARPTMKGLNPYGLFTNENGSFFSFFSDKIFQFIPGQKAAIRTWSLDAEVTQVYVDKANVAWAGTNLGGLYRIDLNDPKGAPALFVLQALGEKEIKFIINETPTVLLLGTNKGLYRLDIQQRIPKLIPGTETFFIRSIFLTDRGSTQDKGIWFTTYNRGFGLYMDSHLTIFPLDKNRYLTTAHCIVEDKNGYFWIPTNKGLFQAKKQELLQYARKPTRKTIFYNYFSANQGFNTNEFNGGCQPCAVRLPDGHVSLPSLNGLVWFIPENIRAELPDGSILADRLEVDGKNTTFYGDTIRLSPDFKHLKISVTTAYFGHANNLHFSYALVPKKQHPVENDWVVLSAANPAILISNQKHGTYNLFIRKTNGFDENNYAQRQITLSIHSEWYQTWWFYTVLLLLIVLLSIWIFTTILNEIQDVTD